MPVWKNKKNSITKYNFVYYTLNLVSLEMIYLLCEAAQPAEWKNEFE